MDSNINLDTNKSDEGEDFRRYSAEDLREICMEEGADDVGFVEIGREALSSAREDILRVYPNTATIVLIVKTVNRESFQSPSASVADYETTNILKDIADTTGRIIHRLNSLGIRGVTVPPAFPMDLDRWPGKVWEVSHKKVAVEAGIGHMGIHRLVIHPRFGNHILLDSILIDARLDHYNHPLPENPCIECRLCVLVCPTGAIRKDGEFDFMSCTIHTYHELFGGFQEWIEEMVSSNDIRKYRSTFWDSETLTKWQSLTYGNFYRCWYCMAVCPAGEESVKVYQSDKKKYYQEIVKPLVTKKEPVYVIAETSAERAAKSYEKKYIRYVRNTIRPNSISAFIEGVPLLFNPEKAEGLNLTLHFEFTGNEPEQVTIVIDDGNINIQGGHQGKPDLRINSDSEIWIKMLNDEISPLKAMVTGKLKLKGNPVNLQKFKNCIL